MIQINPNQKQPLPAHFNQHLFQVFHIKLLALIGQGLTSYVYRVQKINTNGEQYALKVYTLQKNDKNMKPDRLKMQYEIQVRVLQIMKNQKGIIKIYQHGIYQIYGFVLMQLILGGTMNQFYTHLSLTTNKPNKPMNSLQTTHYMENNRKQPSQIEKINKNILIQLVLILQKLQYYGLIHRDLKFENLMLDNNFILKLTDFGTVQIIQSQLQQKIHQYQYDIIANLNKKLNQKNQYLVGSKHYLCPQLISGKKNRIISHKIDIWSFGIIAYRMFCGRFPFEIDECTKNSQYYHKICTQEPPYPSFLTQPQKQLITLCLQKNPNNRPTAFSLQKLPYFTQFLTHSHDPHFTTTQPHKQLQLNPTNSHPQKPQKSHIIWHLSNDTVKYYKYKHKNKQIYEQISSSINFSSSSQQQYLKQKQDPHIHKNKKSKTVHVLVEEDQLSGKMLKVVRKSELGQIKLTCLKMKQLKIKKFDDRQVKIQRKIQENEINNEEFQLQFSNGDHLQDFIALFKNQKDNL